MIRDFAWHLPAKKECEQKRTGNYKMNDSIGNVRKTLTRFERNCGKLTHLSTASFATFMMLSIRRSTNIHVHLVIDLLLIEKRNHFYFHRLFTAW